MTRDEFREAIFKRDNYKCVICGSPAKDAHHIIERKLFDNGGYFMDNGASLCADDHIKAEQTTLSCDEIRVRAGITNIILPEHFDTDNKYDKWGNVILSTGQRLRGELFFDESVQKILKQANLLNLFSKYIKYPRTLHLPWSEKLGSDDKRLSDCTHFEGKEVIVTIKMDGENTTMYDDHIHARSLNSGAHESRSWVKGKWSEIAHEIPTDWRICGENMYAVHTIEYKNLSSYFFVYSIWNEKNEALSWDETVAYCSMLNLETIPVIYRGIYNEALIKGLYQREINGEPCEGYVIRLTDGFTYGDFRKSVAKYVSNNFKIADNKHWMQQKVVANGLANKYQNYESNS